jgi:polyhydroxyalkanoate synthesis regulator phasin
MARRTNRQIEYTSTKRKESNMNFDSLQELMRNGLQLSVGATVTALETLQDPIKREQGFVKFQQELTQLPNTLTDPYQRDLKVQEIQLELMEQSEQWVQKGKTTEQEARQFVEALMGQFGVRPPQDRPAPTTINITATPVINTSVDYQRELQELILEVSTLRSELESDRQKPRS